MPRIDKEKIAVGVRLILEGIGVPLDDPNFAETPQRVADFYEELLSSKLTEEDYKYFSKYGDLVVVSGVRAHGLCPHHLLPVEYSVDIAYIPRDNVVGISKLVRVVLEEVKFPKLQEKFTEDLAKKVADLVGSDDVLVIVRGRHYCMVMRGVKKDATVITTAARGRFKTPELRLEVIRVIELSGQLPQARV